MAASLSLHAGALEQAKRLHDRLAGVPADAATKECFEADKLNQLVGK